MISNIINEIYKEILLENRESKNINLARKYAKSKGYDDEQAQKLIDGIRTDIPNSRLGQCKFLMGIVRLFLDNQLSDGSSIQKLNKLLPYIASDTHIKEYDNNINDLSLDEINNKFSSIQQQDAEQSKKNSYSKQHVKNNDYTIVRIPDFKTASKYGEYTSWCVTHSDDMYMNYTTNGRGLFYFCLKNGFETVPKEKGENAPLDEYGLSMIAVSVDEEGEPNTITSRWNHDMEGNDHIMSKDELENLLGVNFYETFKPYSKEELKAKGFLSLDDVRELLANGTNPSDIFYEFYYAGTNDWYIVILKDRSTLYNKKTNKIIDFNKWLNFIGYFNKGFALVGLNHKWSYIDTNGKLIYNGELWFDDIYVFKDGFSRVYLDDKHKYSLINSNGKLIGDGNLWFDKIYDFNDGLAKVISNNKISFINTQGELIGNGNLWFDGVWDFSDGFAQVKLNDKWSYIDTNGNLVGNGKIWFDYAGKFYGKIAKIEKNDKFHLIDNKLNLIGDKNLWFDEIYIELVGVNSKFMIATLNGKKYLLDRKGNIYDKNQQPLNASDILKNENTIKSKNTLLNEIYNEILLEYSADQKLPFDNDEFKNKNYLEQYTDWLEDFGKYGTLPKSTLDFWVEVKKTIDYIIKNKLRNRIGYGLDGMNPKDIFLKLKNDIIGKYLTFDDNGNVYVERSVRINNSANTYDKSNEKGEDPKKLYNSLVKNYQNNVGGCWSYAKDMSVPYCSTKNGDVIILKGYIRTDDIDFVKTILLNFHYYDEHEIRVKPNAKVELDEVIFDCKYKLPLKGHLIVNATYFGNNGKYNGDYAPIDDGFGNKNQYIDRNGNIKSFSDMIYKKIKNGAPLEDLFDKVIYSENKGYKIVKLNNKWTFMDNNNKLFNDGKLWFDGFYDFYDGFAQVKLNDKWSFIDTNGKLIYDGKLWFDDIYDFDDEFAIVKLNDRYSFISTKGKLIGNGNMWFISVDDFHNGFGTVILDEEIYLIDANGKLYDYDTKQPVWKDKWNSEIESLDKVLNKK